MIKRTQWLGMVLAFVTSVALLSPGPAFALPVNPPKIGMVCLNGPSFTLFAKTGYIQTPDGNSVFMWSYADSSGQFQSPGPVLCVTQGQTVTINLTNNLPEADRCDRLRRWEKARVSSAGQSTVAVTEFEGRL